MVTTGFALMAFLSGSNVPDVGRHGLVVRGAVDFLVGRVPEDGYVGRALAAGGDGSGMHGQGVVTVALAEAYGVEQGRQGRAAIRAALARSLGVILAAIVMILLPEMMREFSEYRMLMFGAMMVLMMIWRPQGLLPMQRPHMELRK